MLLTAAEVQQAIAEASASFPHLSNWEFNNEVNQEYVGFSLWGELVFDENDHMPRRFYVTFDTYQQNWRGYLSIGQHCYYWSDADAGDAHLADTEPCATLGEAITALKAEIGTLVRAFSVD